ncbi:MAG: hypothetical protein EOP10_05290 [Proteobacteria bacterium]|nr:MAG: hypothetical protein EOP10_05290 [Pseudomonadota bacterium]
MAKIFSLLIFIAIGGGGCTGPSNDRQQPVNSADAKPTPVVKPEPKPPTDEVIPPSPLTGSFLFCQVLPENKGATSTEVGCSLKVGPELANVDPNDLTKSIEFGFETVAGLSVSKRAGSGDYQVMFSVKSLDGQPVADRVNDVKFVAKAIIAANKTDIIAEATTEKAVIGWVTSRGQDLPPKAIKAGTENHKTLDHYLCRIRLPDKIILGKMLLNYDVGTICYANSLGAYFNSNAPYAGDSLYPFDVLVMESGKFEDLMEWKEAKGSEVPVNSVTVAVDPMTGESLYSCRALDNGENISQPDKRGKNDKEGEYQPGELRPGKGCYYNYVDNPKAEIYQVLTWKSETLKNAMDSRVKN